MIEFSCVSVMLASWERTKSARDPCFASPKVFAAFANVHVVSRHLTQFSIFSVVSPLLWCLLVEQALKL